MLTTAAIILNISADGTVRELCMDTNPGDKGFWLACIDEYITDERRRAPFIFLDKKYIDMFEEAYAAARTRRLGPNFFYKTMDTYTFKQDWLRVPLCRNDLLCLGVSLPKYAVLKVGGFHVTGRLGELYEVEVQLDEVNDCFIVYSQIWQKSDRESSCDLHINFQFTINQEHFESKKAAHKIRGSLGELLGRTPLARQHRSEIAGYLQSGEGAPIMMPDRNGLELKDGILGEAAIAAVRRRASLSDASAGLASASSTHHLTEITKHVDYMGKGEAVPSYAAAKFSADYAAGKQNKLISGEQYMLGYHKDGMALVEADKINALVLHRTEFDAATAMSAYLPQETMELIEQKGPESLKIYAPERRSEKEFQSFLLCAAASGLSAPERLAMVRQLLDTSGKLILAGDEHGLTIVHVGAMIKDMALLQLGSEKHFAFDKRVGNPAFGPNVLHIATAAGFSAGVQWLVNVKRMHDEKVAFPLPDGEIRPLSLLQLAIATGQEQEVLFYLKDSRFNREFGIGGWGNILHLAVRSFNNNILQRLLSVPSIFNNDALLNESDMLGRSPLALAGVLGNLEAIYHLRHAKRTNVDLPNASFDDYTPLHFAIDAGQVEAVKCLIGLGASLTRNCIYKFHREGESPQMERLTPHGLATRKLRESRVALRDCVEGSPAYYEMAGKVTTFTSLVNILHEQETLAFDFKFLPHALREITYRNLIFMGGGPKGIVHAGAIEALWAIPGFIKNIERVGGTSAGAITAGFLAVGYSASELGGELRSMMPYDQFLEGKSLDLLNQRGFARVKTLLDEGRHLLNPINFVRLIKALYEQKGLVSGEVFREFIEERIAAKTGKKWCTFGELANLIKTRPGQEFRHLHVVTTYLKQPMPEIRVLSSEDPSCKDYIISDAIRASMSLPVIFEPHILHKKDDVAETRGMEPHAALCMDGGMLANYPMVIFDKAIYKHRGLIEFEGGNLPEYPIFNEETLGFYIEPEASARRGASDESTGKIELLGLLKDFYYNAEAVIHKFEDRDGIRTIRMNPLDVSTYSFDLTAEQQAALVAEGRRAVQGTLEGLAEKYVQRFHIPEGAASAAGDTLVAAAAGPAAEPGRPLLFTWQSTTSPAGDAAASPAADSAVAQADRRYSSGNPSRAI